MKKEKYILKKSEINKNYWVLTDTVNLIVVEFEHKKFNEAKKITELENQTDVMKLARVLREIGDWLHHNHYDKIF